MEKINLKKELERAIERINNYIKLQDTILQAYRRNIKHSPFDSVASKSSRRKLYYLTKEIKELRIYIKAYTEFAEAHNITLFDNESEN